MAKAKKTTAKTTKAAKSAKKAVKKTVKTPETSTAKATTLLRKGVLAYVGMYGAAFEQAQTRFTQAREATDGLFDTLVEKGEEIEVKTTEYFKDAQAKVTKTYETNAKKVRSALPTTANDRVEELEAELKALNKKIVSMGKKARSTVKAKAEAVEEAIEDVKAA